MKDLKERNKNEVNDMVLEIETLHNKMDDNKDKEQMRVLRREVEEYKRKYQESQREAGELRKQRDQLKLERNDLILSHSKELDSLNTAHRTLSVDYEKHKFKLKNAEDDLQHALAQLNEKNMQIQNLLTDNDRLKESQMDMAVSTESAKKLLMETEERLKEREGELEGYVSRLHQEEREKYILDRNEKSKLQNQIEILEKSYLHSEEARKRDGTVLQEDFNHMQKEFRILLEEKKMLMRRITALQDTMENMAKVINDTTDRKQDLEKEYAKLQEKHRVIMASEQEHLTAQEHLGRIIPNHLILY